MDDLKHNIRRISPGDLIFFCSDEYPVHVSIVYSVDKTNNEVKYCQYNPVKGPNDNDNVLNEKNIIVTIIFG